MLAWQRIAGLQGWVLSENMEVLKHLTFCDTVLSVAVETRTALAAGPGAVVMAISEGGAGQPGVAARLRVVGEHCGSETIPITLVTVLSVTIVTVLLVTIVTVLLVTIPSETLEIVPLVILLLVILERHS